MKQILLNIITKINYEIHKYLIVYEIHYCLYIMNIIYIYTTYEIHYCLTCLYNYIGNGKYVNKVSV